ncbi:LYR motif-containing protein 9 isoform X2 [Cephus cinctus]|uniref:LYR motif-containing protein 9 n=1 Tax=Cephus cinctus TaxID=211228 RepID=A0AAJ7RDL7_CEPCN|nr:LYR motif-containing protein 9 isoform X2 [Cephus cinctus]XP_024938948.1 LYR motif-containing protein 9 isoform X2 [Cephus cinctus]
MVMGSAVLRTSAIDSPKLLYKFLLRECQKLPHGAKEFYKHSIKQNFKQHVYEPDPERVKQIIQRALDDAKWIVQKYEKQ